MDWISETALLEVYQRLKEKYSIKLTNTAALNDGFSIDCLILVAAAHGQILYLYYYDGDFVLDVMNAEKTKGCHWHPFDVESAVNDITAFMEGESDYPFADYKA